MWLLPAVERLVPGAGLLVRMLVSGAPHGIRLRVHWSLLQCTGHLSLLFVGRL
jgi:hypothetical protein